MFPELHGAPSGVIAYGTLEGASASCPSFEFVTRRGRLAVIAILAGKSDGLLGMKHFFVRTQLHSVMVCYQMVLNRCLGMFNPSEAHFTFVKCLFRFKFLKLSLI